MNQMRSHNISIHSKSRCWIGLGIALTLVAARVDALPGQSTQEAEVWIRSNETLQPSQNEKLLIRKSDTPAQRFTFRASLLKVGRATPGAASGIIRTEEISLVDLINGVTFDRLQESLRVIYGVTIYQDYTQARIVDRYPKPEQLDQSVNRKTPLLAALQGEIREGDRYAYWLEIARRPDGFAYTGRITVFLRADLPKLAAELRDR
jgi:hypothetical protein